MTTTASGPRERDRIALDPIRRITNARLAKSREMVPVSLFAEAPAEAILDASRASGVTVTAVLARLLAGTLRDHPDLNAAIGEDAIVRFAEVFLGIAVALPDGNLTVGVVPRADELDLPRLAEAIADVAARARDGKLTLSDVRGATFTLSSVGMAMAGVFGTPVIPPGQCGILLVSGAQERCVWRDGRAAPGRFFPLSLTFDHRVVNGMVVLAFLRELVARIAEPDPWLEGGAGDS